MTANEYTFPPAAQPGVRWARLMVNVRTSLRRGAWYRVLSLGSEEVVVEVRGNTKILSRDILEIATTLPRSWSVIRPDWGKPYLVCPMCAARVRTSLLAGTHVCPDCREQFPVEQDVGPARVGEA